MNGERDAVETSLFDVIGRYKTVITFFVVGTVGLVSGFFYYVVIPINNIQIQASSIQQTLLNEKGDYAKLEDEQVSQNENISQTKTDVAVIKAALNITK